MPILRGRDGERRMGKSLGNYIGVGETAYEQFAKTMSIPDVLMKEWFELLTDRLLGEIAQLTSPSRHPMEAKATLGKDIVAFYYGPTAAEEAAAEWRRRFSDRQDPNQIEEKALARLELTDGKILICKLLTLLGLAKSNNEARRAVQQGGVTIGDEKEKITDLAANIPISDGLIVRIGKRQVVRVKLN
jgi:tyrosyl-tRNA synthetase